MKRLALLYTEPAGYTRSCLQSLRSIYGTQIFAIVYPIAKNAPFSNSPLLGLGDIQDRNTYHSATTIAQSILDFKPDAVYVSGWSDAHYLKAARKLKQYGILTVSGLDTQFNGSIRQRIGIALSPFILKPAFEYLWVPGDRQLEFARKLGYNRDRCLTGLYCCDHAAFSFDSSRAPSREPTFLFVGRFVHEKGIDILKSAYLKYRDAVTKPWGLTCAGTGPLVGAMNNLPGVTQLGFVQPGILPQIMRKARAFILPSRHEPWGVVVQEAAAASLPIICSTSVGACAHLVQDQYNGFVFEDSNIESLYNSMVRLSQLPSERINAMGLASHNLSKQFLPDRWAHTLASAVQQFYNTLSSGQHI